MNTDYILQLKQILDSQSLTQKQLAEKLDISFAALNRWLNKHAIPHKKRLGQISRLHREVIGYSSITPEGINSIISETDNYRGGTIWEIIESRQDLLDDLLLEHTYNSTTIEGTTFTKKQTEAVIFDKLTIKDKSLIEHLDVVNYSVILRKILKREFPQRITEASIKEVHRLLMQGVREDGGSYSQHQRGIRGLDMMLTHPQDIPEEMGRLIRRWNSWRQKNIQSIAKFHSDFELIHPFGDGNGRVGRLIMVLQCQAENYAPVIIENSRKAEYYEVLEYAQRKSEYPFVHFLVDEMKRTFRIIEKYSII